MLRFCPTFFLRSYRWQAVIAALFISAAAQAPGATADSLALAELQQIYTQAADRAFELQPNAVIAIVDRDGRALLVRHANGTGSVSAVDTAIAVAKAGTAVFLSSNGEAFTSRTAGFIIQQNFPPRVLNRPNGPLVGVGFSNLAYSDINFFQRPDGSRIPGTRLYASPGGVPLYKNGVLVAGIGVTGDGTEQEDASIMGADNDEAIALAGQIGFTPGSEILGSNVFIDGIALPYVASEAKSGLTSNRPFDATGVNTPSPVTWPTEIFGGVAGQVRAPMRADPLAGSINGQARLTEAEVRQIIANAAARTLVTRGGIRLPAGQPAAVFIAVVNNPAQAGVAPAVLGTFRTPDATLFSWDVAVQKARTAVFFSNSTRAFSTRTVGFLAQTMYPPGLTNQPAGPFNGLQERFSVPLLSGTAGANPNLPNGMTIFAGGFPLYRNGVLIGAIGVSGDGIDQDDLIAASGTAGFLPPDAIRADNMSYLGARLPYAKFPRDAELRPNVDPVTSLPASFQALSDSTALIPGLIDLGVQLGGASSTTAPASSTDSTTNPTTTNPPANSPIPFPAGIAVDGAGNVYISDLSTDSVKKISPAGEVTLLAGTGGQSGSNDGTGAGARFNDPGAILLTPDGSLIVSDTGNATIRRITSAGVVTTLAGSSALRGNADAVGSAATFSAPLGIAQDASGTLYVADAMNNTIRRISAGGAVSTFAGSPGATGDADGTGSAARFNHPSGLALDAAGNLYVSDSVNNTIRKISPGGNVTTLAGLSGVSGSQNGTGIMALFNNPGGLAIDGTGTLYVADTGNSCIRQISPSGVVSTYAGLPGVAGFKNGVGTEVWFNQPRSVALDGNGILYVADTANGIFRKITPSGVTSTPVLTVTETTLIPPGSGTTPNTGTTPTTGGGGGGGGGSVSAWFLTALLTLGAARYFSRWK